MQSCRTTVESGSVCAPEHVFLIGLIKQGAFTDPWPRHWLEHKLAFPLQRRAYTHGCAVYCSGQVGKRSWGDDEVDHSCQADHEQSFCCPRPKTCSDGAALNSRPGEFTRHEACHALPFIKNFAAEQGATAFVPAIGVSRS